MRIEVVIDELVLSGFDARDRHRLADGLERRLKADLSATRGAAHVAADATRRSISRLGTEPIHVAGARPEVVGARAGSTLAAAIARRAIPRGNGRGDGR